MSDETRVARLERLLGFLERDPENGSLRADVFEAALGAGNLPVAQEQVEHALRASPEDASWRHRQAAVHLASRRYGEAQAVYESLIAQGLRDPGIVHDLAFALFRQGRVETASEVLEPLLRHPSPQASIVWTLWLRCQHRLERSTAALAALRARLAVHPVPVEALGVASIMAADEEELVDAVRWADEALRARPDQMEALATKGTIALAALEGAEAQRWFERALERNPDDGRCWSGIALARALVQDLAGADAAFRRAVQGMPDHAGTWIAWGWCQLVNGSISEAKTSFEQALRIDRNAGEGHGALAVALAKLGQPDAARREIDLARRLDASGYSARYAEAVLSGEANDARAMRAMARAIVRSTRTSERSPPAG